MIDKEKNQIKLLVADDEQGLREMLKMELELQGFQVVTVADGAQALEELRKRKFQLVLTDLKMPQMDGLLLLENIKKLDPSLEVIVMTGYGTIEAAVAAMKMGASDFILKPFHLDVLSAQIEKSLEKRQMHILIALYESSKAIFSTIRLEVLFQITMDILQNVFGGDEGSLMLMDEQNCLSIAASKGIDEEVVRKVHLQIGERVSGYVAQQREPKLLINGLEKYSEFKDISSNDRIQSSMVCPLVCQNNLLGVLNVSRLKGKENFDLSDLQSLTIFASQLALAIQNSKLFTDLQSAYKELEQTQHQLVQSEKLASIGRLVAGVAHELNNPLTSVIGYSQLALSTQKVDDIQKHLPIIYDQARRCSEIVKDLLIFARRQKINREIVDMTSLIDVILNGFKLEIEKYNITVQRHFPSGPLSVPADPHQIRKVISNILSNGVQALELTQGVRQLEVSIKEFNQSVQIVIADTGPGMPKENLKKIFDPFFTTKDVGKGTGLGLSLAYGIIKEHGGDIFVQSEMDKGTVFTIELPLNVPVENAKEAISPEKKFVRNGVSRPVDVLLVEDEKDIRQLIMKILDFPNYHFDVAEDGEAALGLLQRKRYDIVLCDYRIPKVDGMCLYKEVKKKDPQMVSRFLFVSGSTEFIENFDLFFKNNNISYLLKPFTQEELIQSSNAILNRDKKEGSSK